MLFPTASQRMVLGDTKPRLGGKNVDLSFSLSFRIRLAGLHASPRAPHSCLSVSSWDLSSNFGA